MATLYRLLDDFHSVHFNIEPSKHLTLAHQYVREAAAELAYPTQHNVVRKPGLSSYTVGVLRRKVRTSTDFIRVSRFLRFANARACFYTWRGRLGDNSRAVYCSVRGFSSKHLCLRQIFGHATESARRTQLASLLELEHLTKLDKAAEAAPSKVITEDPLTLSGYVTQFIPSKQKSTNMNFIEAAGSKPEHQAFSHNHVKSVMQAPEKNIDRSHISYEGGDTKRSQDHIFG